VRQSEEEGIVSRQLKYIGRKREKGGNETKKKTDGNEEESERNLPLTTLFF